MDDWTDRAACKGVPTDVFFPFKSGSITEALQFCDACEVTRECANLGLRCTHGVFAGEDLTERGARERLRAKAGVDPQAPSWATNNSRPRLPRHVVRLCRSCRRRMRAGNASLYEVPDTVREVAHRLCGPCYRAQQSIYARGGAC